MPSLHNATLAPSCHACDFACQDVWRVPSCLVFFVALALLFAIVFIQIARIMCTRRRFAFIHLNPRGTADDRAIYGWHAPPSKYTTIDESTIAPAPGVGTVLEVFVTGGSGDVAVVAP